MRNINSRLLSAMIAFVAICSFNAFAFNSLQENLSINFDKETYADGDKAKFNIIVKKNTTIKGFDFIIEAELISGGTPSEIVLHRFNNIFNGTTRNLSVGNNSDNFLNIVLKLQNSKKIYELTALINKYENEIVRLETIFRETNNPEIARQISDLNRKNKILHFERARQSTIIGKTRKKINVTGLTCNFSNNEEIFIRKTVASPRQNLLTEYSSQFFEIKGQSYEVRFMKSKKNIQFKTKRSASAKTNDACSEEGDIELSDDMLPSWLPRESTYESSVRCFKGEEPVKCRASYFLTEGACDGRHSKAHTGLRSLGNIKGKLPFFLYDVPATSVGMPYTYVAPDMAGDVIMNWQFVFPEEEDQGPVNTQYLLRVYVPQLVDLQDTLSLSSYLYFDIDSHDYGTYGVKGFGEALLGALVHYVDLANAQGIPNSPQQFYPLKSEGGNLQFGGLFDIHRNWTTPHKTHRQGVDIDIGMSKLKIHSHRYTLMGLLKRAMVDAEFLFPVDRESHRADYMDFEEPGFHWHIKYPTKKSK